MLLAMIGIIEEEDMPAPPAPSWRLQRRPSPRPDGQQRWDRAYLRLLQWTPSSLEPQPSTQIGLLSEQEDSHDRRLVRARFDPAPSPDAND